MLFGIWCALAAIPMYLGAFIGGLINDEMSGILGLLGFMLAVVVTIIVKYYHKNNIEKQNQKLTPPSLDEFKKVVVNKKLEDTFIQTVINEKNYKTLRLFIDTTVKEINSTPIVYDSKMQHYTGIDKEIYNIDPKMFCLTNEEVKEYYGNRLYDEREVDEVLNYCRRLVVIMMLGKQGLLPSWFFDNNKGFAKSDYQLITKEWLSIANNLVAWINFQLLSNDKFTYVDKNGDKTPKIKVMGVIYNGDIVMYSKLAKYKYSVDSYIWNSMLEG